VRTFGLFSAGFPCHLPSAFCSSLCYDVGMGYLYTFLKPSHAYCQAWQEYRRRRKLAWVTTAAMFPVAILGSIVVSPLAFALKSDVPVGIVFFACIGFCVWMHLRRLFWPCPLCGRAFHLKVFYFKGDFDRCKHCGLEKYAPCDPANQKWEFADQSQ
jgi:hypothetical protein